MIKYHLVENPLTERADDYTAQVISAGSLDKEAIVERMLQRGTLLTKTDILAVLNNYEETIVGAIKEGYNVALPLHYTGFSISGVFNGATDAYEPTRHSLKITINKGTLLRSTQSEVKLEKTNSVVNSFVILEVRDTVSGTANTTLTPNGVMELVGSNIKIIGDKPACGIYLVSANGTETKVSTIVQNKPSALICMIPALEVGTYRVKVVTQYSANGKALNEARTTTYERSLVVL